VETPSILNEKLLLSGVNRISNVVAEIPLLSIQVAREFEPIESIAVTHRTKDKRERRMNNEGDCGTFVRFGREKRIAPGVVLYRE
jgi:hypothetical protein